MEVIKSVRRFFAESENLRDLAFSVLSWNCVAILRSGNQ